MLLVIILLFSAIAAFAILEGGERLIEWLLKK